MLPALIPALAPIVSRVVGNLFPDPAEKAKAEAEAMRQLLAAQSEIQAAAGEIGLILRQPDEGGVKPAAARHHLAQRSVQRGAFHQLRAQQGAFGIIA